MGLSTWKDKYRHQGAEWSLEQFVDVAGHMLEQLGMDERSVPNDRLVRYYAAEGVLRKPGKDGREARYAYQHLVEFLVTRMLLKDGWQLSKVADFMTHSDLGSLEQMLPDHSMTRAEVEMRAIKRKMAGSSFEPAPSMFSSRVSRHVDSVDDHAVYPVAGPLQESFSERSELFPEPARDAKQKMLDLQGTMARGRSSLAHLLHSLGFAQHKPAWKDTASIDLTPWCTVTFDADELKKLSPSAFEPLGEALAQSLREHRMATRRERK